MFEKLKDYFKFLKLKMIRRILVCGDRNWTDEKAIEDVLEEYPNLQSPTDITIIHGGCRGADQIAGKIAKKYGMKIEVFYAEWDKSGLRAGPLRNSKMLKDGRPDLVIAFHKNLDESKGTKDMVNKAKVLM